MKTRKGFIQGYNSQIVVSEDQSIVVCDVTKDCNDFGQLQSMVEMAEANLYEIGEEPEKLLAAAGYCKNRPANRGNSTCLNPQKPSCGFQQIVIF